MFKKFRGMVSEAVAPAWSLLTGITLAAAVAVGGAVVGEALSGASSDVGYTPVAQTVVEVAEVVRVEFAEVMGQALVFSAYAADGEAVQVVDLGINYAGTVTNIATAFGIMVVAFLGLLMAVILYRVFTRGATNAVQGRS